MAAGGDNLAEKTQTDSAQLQPEYVSICYGGKVYVDRLVTTMLLLFRLRFILGPNPYRMNAIESCFNAYAVPVYCE